MIAGDGILDLQRPGHDCLHLILQGVRVRVWKACISHSVSYLELKKAYSKYCIAHPNICAVLGVCIQVIATYIELSPQKVPAGQRLNDAHESADLASPLPALIAG